MSAHSGDHETAPAGIRTAQTNDAATELDRLRAERDGAVAALNQYEHRRKSRTTVRGVIAGILVVLFAILLPLTVTSSWAHRTVLNTNSFVNTVAPIASNPAVTSALSVQIANQAYAALDPEPRIAAALPPRATFLAGPIADATKTALQKAVNRVLNSSQFRALWVHATRYSHAQLVAVLHGNTTLLQTSQGQVVLNLVPLLNGVLERSQTLVSGIVGKHVTLPRITGNELPSVACSKIAAALDRPVPATCGQIALFPAAKLKAAQRAVQAFDRIVVILLIITPIVAAGALWASRRRRRTLLQLAIGGMIGLVIVRRVVIWEQNNLLGAVKPENKAALTAIVNQVLGGFYAVSGWFLLGGLILIVLALISGPYRWAVATRRATVTGTKRVGALISAGASGAAGHAHGESAVLWVRRHVDPLMIAGVVVALILLLALPVNVWWALAIVVIFAAYEFWLWRLRPSRSTTAPPAAAPPAQRTG